MTNDRFDPRHVLDLWFPDTGHEKDREAHSVFWDIRMQGGMDEIICADFADLTEAAARGELDEWAETPYGRLALLIALDQFPRSLWRDTPAAFAQDIKACRLALEGIENGHFDALKPWERAFYIIAIGHCEGPDHVQRMEMLIGLTERAIEHLEEPLLDMADGFRAQSARVRDIIVTFGRHPHRNPIYGRLSTPEEEAYIAAGDFPHVKKVQDDVVD